MDTEFGIVGVLGVARRSRVGLSIGSPIAAGAASRVVAVRGAIAWGAVSLAVHEELLHRALIARWLDDLIIIYDTAISDAARAFLSVVSAPRFYGKRLLSVAVQQPEAFGFCISLEGGLTALRPKLKYIGRYGDCGRWKGVPVADGLQDNMPQRSEPGFLFTPAYHGGQ